MSTKRYIVRGEMQKPGDAEVTVVGLNNAKSFFADMVIEGAKFVTLSEVIDGHEHEIGRFSALGTATT